MAEPIRLGMVRLTDAAPVVVAQARGLFAAEGVEVAISVEPSWANIADKLTWGALDAAVMLPPLVIAMGLGLRGPVTPLVVPAGVSLNGNAVTVATGLADQVLAGGRPRPGEAMRRLQAAAPGRLRLAVVHAFSTHDLLLRLMLEQGGVDPADVEISVVPPQDVVAALGAGRVDGFCVGAPWGAVAAAAGVGRTVAVTSALWPNHPEKCLAVGGAWAQAHPGALDALVRAVLQAGAACDAGDPEVPALLARPEWVGVDADAIAASLPGGAGGEVDVSAFAGHHAGVPFPVHARWFARQMARWRAMPAGAEDLAAAMWRPDLWARAVGAGAVPASPSLL